MASLIQRCYYFAMTTDPRYDYPRTNAIKVIIQSKLGSVLLLQEPEANDWMPLHWGLPGGKPLVGESLMDAFKRKMNGELGLDIKPEGIVKVEELLQGDKTVIIYHILAKSDEEFNPSGEAKNYKWVSKEEIEKMEIEEFTEFFNKNLLIVFLSSESQLAPISLIETNNYNKLIENKDPLYESWFSSGKRENK